MLGVKTRLENQTFVDDMSEYVDKISPAEVTTKPEDLSSISDAASMASTPSGAGVFVSGEPASSGGVTS